MNKKNKKEPDVEELKNKFLKKPIKTVSFG